MGKKIYKPYIAGCSGNGGLLMDDSTYHKLDLLKQKMDAENTMLNVIPPHYCERHGVARSR